MDASASEADDDRLKGTAEIGARQMPVRELKATVALPEQNRNCPRN
jgi:hypothetical protein